MPHFAGCSLDRQQSEAVFACEDAQLVLASAGSGKTLSLLAKIEYIAYFLNIKPSNILAISFTRKTVAELIERCSVNDVEFRTFHSLGKSILAKSPKYSNYELIDEARIIKIVRDSIVYQVRDRPEFKDCLKSFLFDGTLSRDKNRTKTKQVTSEAANRFCDLMLNFLSHFKNGQHSLYGLQDKISKLETEEQRNRANQFVWLFTSVFLDYERYLHDARLYDFADMINLATELVESRAAICRYKYILLDEVQDLSPNRYLLVRAILRQNPDCRIFAVGDDWQSIYRFAGSNLNLIYDFAINFERFTRKSVIEFTHRFGRPTTRISSDFIKANPQQSRKRVKPCDKTTRTPINIILNDKGCHDDDSTGCSHALRYLLDYYGYEKLKKLTIQVISRYNRDLERLKDSTQFNILDQNIIWHNPDDAEQSLKMEFCSMHKSKGITRDIVIVLNMNDTKTGMPAQRETDYLIDMLLSDQEEFRYAEERRLFYVAITRARKHTICIADSNHPSLFLAEICPDFEGAIKPKKRG